MYLDDMTTDKIQLYLKMLNWCFDILKYFRYFLSQHFPIIDLWFFFFFYHEKDIPVCESLRDSG